MTTTIATAQEYLERVREIEPVLREHDADNERERRLVGPVVDALREAGMYRMTVPRHYGGAELHPIDARRVVEALAEIDASVAWNVTIAGGSFAVGILGDEIADEIFATGPDTVTAAAVAVPVSITSDGDGFVVDGEVRFVSGAHQAEWFFTVAVLVRDGQPVMDATGAMPLIHGACIHRSQVEILDTWHVSAMRGTGSTNVKIASANVPARQVVQITELRPRGTHFTAPAYQLAGWPVIHMEAATSIGIARAAIRDLKGLAMTKVGAGFEFNTIAHRDRTQHNLAKATALVDAASAYLDASMTRALAHVESSGGTSDGPTRADLMLAGWNAADASMRAVDLVCDAAGTTSAMLDHRFERYHRDVHFLAKHASKSTERVTNVGRLLLGIQPAGHPLLDL